MDYRPHDTMFRRLLISILLLVTAMAAQATRVARNDVRPRHPDTLKYGRSFSDYYWSEFTPDSISLPPSKRNDRMYDSLRSKSRRRRVPRLLYKLLFVTPQLDTTANGQIIDEAEALDRYNDLTIGQIRICREKVFSSDDSWIERLGNRTHVMTRERILRRDLLFKPGDKFNSQLVVRNKQLLLSRKYISDVNISVERDSLDTTRVNLVLRTRDSWTVSMDGNLHSGGRTMVGISDANVLGTGNRFNLETYFNRKNFDFGGNMAEYEMPNVLGSFFSSRLAGGRAFFNTRLEMEVKKEFLKPTDYELGLSYSDNKFRAHLLEEDTTTLIKERNLDVWGGNSHLLPSIRSSVYLTWRYNYRRVGRRPDDVGPTRHPIFHDHDALLLGAGLYREKFYTSSMIYGFGNNEYLATGYKAEVTGGYSWGEFSDDVYLGTSLQSGTFCRLGYIMGGFTLGSYIDKDTGMWKHSAIDVNLRWFSHLFLVRRSHIRQFLGINYTQGWNRNSGNDESIRFTRYNGLQMLDKRLLGTNRLVINTETMIFTPYQPLGFRVAVFAFCDMGLLGYSPNIFKNNYFSTLGMGLRIKNERMVFSTIQLQLGIAFGKGGWAGCDYFKLTNAARLEQYRYRPTRPEIVGFK